MSGYIPQKDMKILFLRSGNRCAKCRKILVVDKTENDPESIIAEIAHIKGERPTAPRYDPTMTDNERKSYDNLICLCGDCHKSIDDQPNTYTVEVISDLKNNHERWIIQSTIDEVPQITFHELSVVTEYLLAGDFSLEGDLIITPPNNKILKNNLSSEIERLITMGMTQVKQVAHFIDQCPDIQFGNRLSHGFSVEYEKLSTEDQLVGDDLFNALLIFASGGRDEFIYKAAGLVILTYMFETCEVFEG